MTSPELLLGPRQYLASDAAQQHGWTLEDANAYTRWLATHHYENFHVVSFLLPKKLHQDFFNVYAYCRWSDDLGDEMDSTAESLRLLEWWGGELDRMYRGRAEHPVFVALQSTVSKHGIPQQPFADLLTAFVQDQKVTYYATWADLLDYCSRSANPVGRLILYLGGYRDAERQRLSDSTCTALQLANFWQDVSVDLTKGRVYIPNEVIDRNQYSLDELSALNFTPRFRNAMRECVEYARALFLEGLPLARMVDRRLSLDIDLFSRGGMQILDKIESQGYNVLDRRPAIGKFERVRMLATALTRWALRSAG